ncbi:MAG: hypothetical protein JXQ29_17550 [Planctomycetes bacterium]|nr:hypothetical protein [Planctomycetota bacterium]
MTGRTDRAQTRAGIRRLKALLPHGLLERGLGLYVGHRRRRARRPRRIAGILQTRDYTDACAAFDSLAALCDVTLVLDDNSATPFPFRDRCSEYVALRNRAGWNASANLTLLFYRACVHACDWIVTLEDDLLLSHQAQDRQTVADRIARAERRKLDIVFFRWRDLWDTEERYRTDGVFACKTFPFLRRNWFFDHAVSVVPPAHRLHASVYPENRIPRWEIDGEGVVYHAGCLTRELRQARVDKYRREDPDHRFQADYAYILDETGLETRAVPGEDLEILRRKFQRDRFTAARGPARDAGAG